MQRRFRVSVLGPLVVEGAGGPVDLGPARRRALFAVLVLTEGSWCSREFLLDAVWGGSPPPTGEKVIASYVYALRRVLDGPGVAPADSVLLAGPGAYRLAAGAVEDDATYAARLTAEARLAHERDDPAAARELLSSAEVLWRGEPLAGLPGPFAQAQRARLTELHTERVARRLDLDLELGFADRLIPELREMLAADPTAEATAGRLMRALHQMGRRSEALEVYESTGRAVQRELGMPPAVALQLVHRDVLTGEAAQPRPAVPARPPDGYWVTRCDLPVEPAGFVGREAEVDRLCAEPADTDVPVVRLLDGMGGAGKTTLALRVAHRLAGRYPDGQLFVDLHGHTPGRSPAEPAEALGRLLRRVGVPEPVIPGDEDDLAALWRATVAGRRMLLVLDNAATAAQVRPLLPGGAGCQVLITSRERLADLDADTVGVGMLGEAEAMSLFRAVLPDPRDFEDARPALRRVVRACGYLPLALRISAARLRNRPGWTAADLAERLADGSRPFADLGGGDGGVRAVFDESYDGLEQAQQAMFRALGALPGGRFDEYVAAAVAGLSRYDGADLLGALVEANLLVHDADGRYHLHDLLRRYALLRLGERPPAERVLARARVLDYYLHTVQAVKELAGVSSPAIVRAEIRYPPRTGRTFDSRADAFAWAGAEIDNVVALLQEEPAEELADRVWRAVNEWYFFCERFSVLHAYHPVLERGLAAARLAGSAVGEQTMNARMGTRLTWRGSPGLAREYLQRALRGAEQLDTGDPYFELHARAGIAACDTAAGRHRDVIRQLELLLELAERHGYRVMAIGALNSLGLSHHLLGDYPAAIHYFTRCRDAGDTGNAGPDLANLGAAHLGAGDLDPAQRMLGDAHAEFERVGHQDGLAYTGAHLGLLHARRGDPERALDAHRRAVAHARGAAGRRIRCVAHQCYGDTLYWLGRVREAAEEYGEAAGIAERSELVGEHVEALAGLARCHARAGEPERARRSWAEAWKLGAELDLPVMTEVREQHRD